MEAEGADYARKSQFISNARAIIEANDITAGERQLHAEIEYTADGNAVITLTDAAGNVLDVYNIDPFTGVGTESDGGEVNLPQTGYSVVYNYIMLAAAAMVLFGIYAMAKSRKRDEE